MHIQVKRVRDNGDIPLPAYHSALASGMDLRADVREPVVLDPGRRALIPTGLAVAIPAGYEAQVRPRSGLALKHGLTLVNTPGTIDADYRGEIGVILINLGGEPFAIQRGDRIAQLVIAPVVHPHVVEVDTLEESQRGAGGFGSTGR